MGPTKRQIEEQIEKQRRLKLHQDRVADIDENILTIKEMNKQIDEQNRR